MTTAVDDTIEIDDIGAIQHLELPCRPGTVVELTGTNGAGKTTALRTVDAIAGKNGVKLANRDGCHKGSVRFGELQIKVARDGANRRLGERDKLVATLDDGLNLHEIIDPKLKDGAAADLQRIKLLAKLCGAALPIEELQALVGGPDEFEKLVPPGDLDPNDVVGSVAKVKRAFEAAARLAEGLTEKHRGSAAAKRQENATVDMTAEHDGDKLQGELEDLIREVTRTNTLKTQHVAGRAARDEAQRRLASAVAEYTGPTLEAAQAAYEAAQQRTIEQRERCNDIAEQLRLAKAELAESESAENLARAVKTAAFDHDALIAGWRETIAKGIDGEEPTDEDIQLLDMRLSAARQAQQLGVRVRDALKREEDAAEFDRKAKEAEKRAELLREAAQGTLDTLVHAVASASTVLKIDDEFRLTAEHPERGTIYFSDFSPGEQWSIVLDIVVGVFRSRGGRGICAIAQEGWDALDGRNRRIVKEKVFGTDLTLYVAQADRDDAPSDEIQVKVYEGAKA